MSPKNSSSNVLPDSSKTIPSHSAVHEWVEIVEPRSKKKIFANLETGVCAKYPPEGAIISRTEDFSEYWWELYDQKTGKHYYYNPEQQRTAWTKPSESSTANGKTKKLLIIPVSKLQTFKKAPLTEQSIDRCDASTQTIASNLVSIGTQTINESVLENEFNNKLRFIDFSNDSSKSSNSCTHSSATSSSHLDYRQVSDFIGKDRSTNLRNHDFQVDRCQRRRIHSPTKDLKERQSSQEVSDIKQDDLNDHLVEHPNYIGPPLSYHKDQAPLSIQSPVKYNLCGDKMASASSTFGSRSKPPIGPQPQQLTTNNLSHYLVREARAMGIALISDDELDNDDQDSDEDCAIEDDEDTDLRDDTSSHHDAASELRASQDLGENSSEGWKSFSDQESPNGTNHKSHHSIEKSPIHCETSESFTFNELIDDEKNPASCMSQQLDHRKLVENFKKSRQTSSFGLQDSLGRSYKLDANHAVQKIKTVADSYFHHDKEQPADRQLRQLSTLSTLPRPRKETRDKIALSKPEDPNGVTDADYDVVEENCGYYSDSEQAQSNQLKNKDLASGLQPKTSLLGESTPINSNFDRNKSSRGSTFSVESFARENLTRHPKKGSLLFNRRVKWSRMISWTKNPIKQPMISSVSSDLYADSIISFKLIQQFMGDRKITITKKYRQVLAQSGVCEDSQKDSQGKGKNNLGRSGSINLGLNHSVSNSTNANNIPDRLRDELAYELVVKGCSKSALRDEIYVQLARQLTENPSHDSINWGLILMSILLSYFSPSSKFSPFLLSFLETHSNQMARDVCLPRLEKRLRQSWLTYCRKPADGKEISIVRLSITKWPQYCGVFGESLDRIMSLQTCSPYLKTLRLPWILTTLAEKLMKTGSETEGIFRCAADHDLIAQLRLEIDCVDFRKITDAKQVRSLLSNVQDPHVIAGLLKLFFRQLYEPVFPTQLYDACLLSGQDAHMACRLFNERLPNLNKDVVAYLIRLLQWLAKSDKVAHTKMDNSNLSMVWAPNLLRAPQEDSSLTQSESKSGSKWSIANGSALEDHHQHHPQQSTVAASQSMIFEQTRQEMQFIRSLIINLDTSFIENVI